MKNPIPVNEVLMHKCPHLDEITAYHVLVNFGSSAFPGIDKAFLRLVEADIIGNDEQYDKDKILPVGCGGGRFDEHRPGIERLDDECATTLVELYLGISANSPVLNPLFKDVLQSDTSRGCKMTQLAELIKIGNRRFADETSYTVINMVRKALGAIIRQLKYPSAAVPREKGLVDLFLSLDAKSGRYKANARVRGFLLNEFRRSETSEKVTELGYVVKCMFRAGYTEPQVTEWVQFFIDRMFEDQVAFWQEVENLKKNTMIPLVTLDQDKPVGFKLMVCHSDSWYTQKAARQLGADLVLVIKSDRHVQLFTGATKPPVRLGNVVRMIRWLELPPNKKRDFDWAELGQGGVYKGAPMWYYHQVGGMLLNSSQTHSAVPATQLMEKAIVEVLQHAFLESKVRSWWAARGIDLGHFAASSRPKPQVPEKLAAQSEPTVMPELEKAVDQQS